MTRKGRGFTVLAPVYDGLASLFFGKAIHLAQTQNAIQLPQYKSILILGGGTGKSLIPLLNQQNQAKITFLDLSAGMLKKAQKRIARHPEVHNVTFVQADFATWQTDGQFDIVLTHFFLDLFDGEELERVLAKISGILKPDGTWWVADFRQPQKGGRAGRARWLIPLMYRFFRFFCKIPAKHLENYPLLLKQRGFTQNHERRYAGEMIFSAIYTAE